MPKHAGAWPTKTPLLPARHHQSVLQKHTWRKNERKKSVKKSNKSVVCIYPFCIRPDFCNFFNFLVFSSFESLLLWNVTKLEKLPFNNSHRTFFSGNTHQLTFSKLKNTDFWFFYSFVCSREWTPFFFKKTHILNQISPFFKFLFFGTLFIKLSITDFRFSDFFGGTSWAPATVSTQKNKNEKSSRKKCFILILSNSISLHFGFRKLTT